MKKILYSLLFVGATLFFTTACSEDRDSNPVINENVSSFVLNTPGIAINNVIDLQNSDYVEFTTNQPAYGIPVSTTYSVYVSLDNQNFTQLATTYTTAKFDVSASEMNEALLDLAGSADVTSPMPVYVKLGACLTSDDSRGKCESNVITLPKVQLYVPVVEISLPSQMYIVGDFTASSSWSKFYKLNPAYGQDGFYYGIVYLAAGNAFKINPDDDWKGNDCGYGQVTIDADNDAAGIKSADESKESANMVASNSGWYTVVVKAKIANGKLNYTLQMLPAKVYLFGATSVGALWEWNDSNLFTAPAGADGNWTSPALAADGEVRLAVDCGIDWWKTEFTLYGSDIYYRCTDIAHNWAEDLGSDYSIQGKSGGHVYLNFTTNTGSAE